MMLTLSTLCALASLALILAAWLNEKAIRRGGLTFLRIGRYTFTMSKRMAKP